ncbi:MAG: N-formylglutamate amidohydrolase [Roseobacter sp.]
MNRLKVSDRNGVVDVLNAEGTAPIVLVCEHASPFIPARFDNLGLTAAARISHAAWDPGALAVAESMSRHLAAPLVASRVSRLVYDCNRPPEAPGAMPAKSEVIDVPGNTALTDAERAERTKTFYAPFKAEVARTLNAKRAPTLVTVHSFTPVYHGVTRSVEIGLLHDDDARLTDAMLSCATAHTSCVVERNAPYGPQDGVTHTLKEHALPHNWPNVMIEIRNDLIATEQAQKDMAKMLSAWLTEALATLETLQCKG